ncbi:MAG: dihydropteroate synthase [Limisphaerales bacterium]
MLFRARQFEFQFPRPMIVMGVVNVTPDSFSDGGQFLDVDAAVDQALRLESEGAEILDIGGESTRPNAEPVTEAEEIRRVVPVIQRLASRARAAISIDTQKPGVAEAALDAGASIVNDIAANREDDAMWRLVARTDAGYVAMHMQGAPQTMQASPHYEDVLAEVETFFQDRLARLAAAGVSPEQVALDPGIGFGKALEHNLALLGGLFRFTKITRPILIGASRKSFMGKLLEIETGDRLPASLACACRATEAGVQIVRVHDVAATVQAVRMTEAILDCRR